MRELREYGRWISVIGVSLALLACGRQSTPELPEPDPAQELAEFKTAIRAKYDMKEQAFRNNNPEPIVSGFYSERVISTDNNGVTHLGRDGIRPIYEEVIGSTVRIESYNTFVNGNAGWDWVNFHVSLPPGANVDPFSFKMLFLWEKIDGEWWSHGEMYVPGKFDLEQTAH